MQRLKFVAILLFLGSTITSAQKKEITLEDIWNIKFATEDFEELYSMYNEIQYSILRFNEIDKTTVDVYDLGNKKLINLSDDFKMAIVVAPVPPGDIMIRSIRTAI